MTGQSATPSPDYRPADSIDVAQLKRVLIVMLRHHGDVLLTSPLIEALRREVPNAQIDVLIYTDTAPMLEHNPAIHQLLRIDRSWKDLGALGQISAEWGLLRALSRRRYDLLMHLSNHRRGAWLARALRPRWSIAARQRVPSRFWEASFTHLYANGLTVHGGSALAKRHMVEQHLDALRRLGIPVEPSPKLTLVPGAEGERAAAEFLQRQQVHTPFILVQPTSRWMFKCWPSARNAQMIRQLLMRGHTVVLSCAPDPREQGMIESILAHLGERHPRLILATEGSTLGRLAALIGRARLFVGIDSAPMHIAAAMGTPTVALFGPSGEFNWGPWKGDGLLQYRIVSDDQWSCRPCGQDGCGGGKISLCLTGLPVAMVMSAIDDLLRESELLFAS